MIRQTVLSPWDIVGGQKADHCVRCLLSPNRQIERIELVWWRHPQGVALALPYQRLAAVPRVYRTC